jgi:hypothetical protein
VFVFSATNKPSLQTWCHASHFSGRDLVKIPDELAAFVFSSRQLMSWKVNQALELSVS